MDGSARPRWSVSGHPPPVRPSRVSGSPSATSASCRSRDSLPVLIVGVDVGGTTIAAGALSADGEVVVDASAPTPGAGTGGALATIVALIGKVIDQSRHRGRPIDAIGVGVPGPVDAALGRIGEPVSHVPELAGHALAAELTTRFGLFACVDNDVNALALGEWMFGAGRGARSLVVLAAGTGFGAGLGLDRRLVPGAVGFGGELGHAPVKFDGPRCWCGGRGCLALYASGRGIVDSARARVADHAQAPLLKAAGGDPMGITVPGVFHAAAEGDSVAASVVDEACQALGAMIGTVVNGLNPEIIIVTGGVAQSLVPLGGKNLPPAGE